MVNIDVGPGNSGSTGTTYTASNQGTGFGWFKQILNNDIQFKTLIIGTKLSVANNANDLTMDIVESNLNLGNMGGVVGNTQIGTGVVGTSNIANNAVTSALISAGAVGTSQLGSNVVTDANIAVQTSSKISITNKPQLNSAIVYNDQANSFGMFNQNFKSGTLGIFNPTQTQLYQIVASAITGNFTLTLPLITSNDKFTLDSNSTTLTNKTIYFSQNTVTDTSAVLGDLIKHDGTRYDRFAKGTGSQVVGVNAAGTDLIWLNFTSTIDYLIRRVSGTSYIAINAKTGVIDASNSGDLGALLNSVFALLTNGGTIYIEGNANPYVTSTPALIPVQNSSSVKMYAILGDIQAVRGSGGTEISFSSTFPTGRYFLESVAGIGSNQTSTFLIDGLYIQNVLYARSGTTGQNISAGTTVIDAGFLLFGSDHSSNIPFIIQNITTQYLWEGMHFKGYMFFPKIHSYRVSDTNNNCVTNAHIIMERAGYPDYPKQFDMQQIILNSTAGLSGGTGSINNAAVFGGGYHYIQNVYVDGTKYNEAPIAFKQFFSSVVKSIQVIDLNVAQGTGYKGVFLFDSNDYAGNAPTTSYDTYNNVFENLAGVNATSSTTALYFVNGPFRNRIKLWGYWGATAVINDAGAGIENLAEIVEGQQPKTVPNSKVTSTNGNVKIIDLRSNAENKGVKTSTGDGSTKVFTQAHGLFTTPSTYEARWLTSTASGSYDVTVDATNITITYPIAPQNASTLKWYWYASVY